MCTNAMPARPEEGRVVVGPRGRRTNMIAIPSFWLSAQLPGLGTGLARRACAPPPRPGPSRRSRGHGDMPAAQEHPPKWRGSRPHMDLRHCLVVLSHVLARLCYVTAPGPQSADDGRRDRRWQLIGRGGRPQRGDTSRARARNRLAALATIPAPAKMMGPVKITTPGRSRGPGSVSQRASAAGRASLTCERQRPSLGPGRRPGVVLVAAPTPRPLLPVGLDAPGHVRPVE